MRQPDEPAAPPSCQGDWWSSCAEEWSRTAAVDRTGKSRRAPASFPARRKGHEGLRRPEGSATFFPSGSDVPAPLRDRPRSEEHTSELQSLLRISYAVFCLKKKKQQ